MNTNLLDLNTDILEIIGGCVKMEMEKICKKYVMLYDELDREKESESRRNLNYDAREEYYKRHTEDYDHFLNKKKRV